MRLKILLGYVITAPIVLFLACPFILITIELLLTGLLHRTVELFAYYRVLQAIVLTFYTVCYFMVTEVLKFGKRGMEKRNKT